MSYVPKKEKNMDRDIVKLKQNSRTTISYYRSKVKMQIKTGDADDGLVRRSKRTDIHRNYEVCIEKLI